MSYNTCCLNILGANMYLLSSSNYLRTNLISRYTYIKNYVSRNGKSAMYNVKGKYYISIDHVNQYTFNSNHPLKRIYSATFTISTENYGSNWEKYLLKVYIVYLFKLYIFINVYESIYLFKVYIF